MIDRDAVVGALKGVFDPEIPVNIYDLGLIYEVRIDGDAVHLVMTLTSPNCPVAEQLPQQARESVAALDGVGDVTVELTWEPAWSSESMTEDAKIQLEMMGIEWADPLASIAGQRRVTGLTVGRTGGKPTS